MDCNSRYMLTLMKHAIYGTKPSELKEELDWLVIRRLALGHNIYSLLFPAIKKLPKESQPSSDVMKIWEIQAMQQGIHQLSSNFKLDQVLTECRKRNLFVFVVKGVGLAELYPDPLLRASGDIDIIVEENSMEEFQEIISQQKFTMDKEACFKYEMTFKNEEGMSIEVHSSLWEEPEGERRTLLESLHIVTNETIHIKNVSGIQVPMLKETEHLIYIIYHMIKHFFISGIGIRHLADLTLFVSRYRNSIDFIRFWGEMKKLGYEEFCYKVFYLCHEYFDMPKELLPDHCKEDVASCEAMLEDILEAGVFGGSSPVRWKSGRFLRFYYENQNKRAPKSKINMIITFLFPKQEELDNQTVDKYKKSKFLPLAWIQRGHYFYLHWKRDRKICTIRQRVDCASKRIKLLRDLKLMR